MKTYARLVVAAVIAALVLAGCGMPLSPVQETEALGSGGASLPADEVRDVSRSVSGPFTFETLLSVDVRLAVDLYEVDDSGRVLGDALPPETADVFVVLDDSEGNRVYAGMVGDDGVLDASVQLPSAAEDMTLTIRAEGFETRTIVIDDMVTFELIDRKLSLKRVVPEGDGPASRSSLDVIDPNDADGDGVIDTEDDEPDDPTIAFYSYVPSREAITVAYEDLFGREDAGDADYNDFIASYTIREGLNADMNVTQIYVSAEAVQKLAGYDHRFGIRLDSFEGKASVTGSYIDVAGTSRDYSFRPIVGTAEIDLFMNSDYAKDKTAEFTVTFDEPQVRDGSEDALPEAPYNPYLFVFNTGHDIHLIGREANTISKNPDDPFVDEKDFPWALLVPRNWTHPEEGVRIEVDYPRFTLWRESGGAEFQDWYDHYQDPWEPPTGAEEPSLVRDINPGAASSRPNWLTSTATGLYFSASDEAHGNELWRLAAGTVSRLTDLVAGEGGSSPRFLTEHDGDVFFVASNGGSEPGLFRYGSGAVSQIAGVGRPSHLLSTADGLYTSGFTQAAGSELWLYDGTGAAQVADINAGVNGSSPRYLVSFGGQIYFQADDGTNGQELWRFDGVNASLAADINPTGSSTPTNLIVYGGDLYFRATDGVYGYELWRYDGAAATRVSDINPAGSSLTVAEMVVHDGALYFAANDGSSGFELYEYDGLNVRRVADLLPGAGSGVSLPINLISHAGMLYFAGTDGSTGTELYTYDGSAMSLAAEINPSGDGEPESLEVHDNALYFRANDGVSGSELWVYR